MMVVFPLLLTETKTCGIMKQKRQDQGAVAGRRSHLIVQISLA